MTPMVKFQTRLMVAAFGLGAGWAALDRAIPYSTKRIQAFDMLSNLTSKLQSSLGTIISNMRS